jgi:hypothetical protein
MNSNREVIESPLTQGVDEQIKYTLDTTPWGGSPSSATAKIFSISNGTKVDTTITNISGSSMISGNIITLPTVSNLIVRTTYRLEVQFTVGGNLFEAYVIIIGEE